MSRALALWWQRRQLWLPAAAFVLLAVAALAAYQVALAGRLGLQASALASRRQQLADLAHSRQQTEALLTRARATRAAIDELYDQRLGSEAERLTAVMLEVKRLARQARLGGMEAINYDDQPVQGLPLVKKSIVFSATGSYDELRGFIDLLELSPSFLTLEAIHVQGEEGGRLRLQVRLSTLFGAAPIDGRGKA